MARWVFPCDNECSVYNEYRTTLFDDVMGISMGAPIGEIMEDFEAKHIQSCERCKAFGLANVEVK